MLKDHANIAKKIEKFFSHFPLQKYVEGDILIRAEEAPREIFYLRKGLVKQYTISDRGDMFVIQIYKPGAHFMMTWAINHTPNHYNFEAMSPVEISKAPLSEVADFVKKDPEILYNFTSRLLKGLDGFLMRTECLMMQPAYVKTASLLLYLSDKFGERENDAVTIKSPFTHKEIASWIGTTRETASLQLENMKKDGVIKYNRRHLIVTDLHKLQSLV